MSSVLIVYSTVDGHTRTICEKLQRSIEASGHAVQLLPIESAGRAEVQACQKIVVGASIRYGKHRPGVYRFVNEHADELHGRPGAFFTVNIVARKPGKDRPETNPYLKKFLARVRWRPTELDVFAGRLDYPRYGFFDRQMIRFIMLITRGPTDPSTVVEFTDWSRVEQFARRVCAM
ncbi:MAG TPA: menaquinone-dependent protoporphyrinogen IX dehydrogenase [Burkholderiaceae bacterium]